MTDHHTTRAQERTVAVAVAEAIAQQHPADTDAIIRALQTIQGPFPPATDGTIQWIFRLYSRVGFVFFTPDQDFWTCELSPVNISPEEQWRLSQKKDTTAKEQKA